MYIYIYIRLRLLINRLDKQERLQEELAEARRLVAEQGHVLQVMIPHTPSALNPRPFTPHSKRTLDESEA